MRLSIRDPRKSPFHGWSMTAMIDVVFLLLVFFLTTSSFVVPQQDLEAAIAAREPGAGDVDEDLEPARVVVWEVGGQTNYRMGAVTTTDPARISEMLRSFSYKSPGLFVEVGSGVPYGVVARLVSKGRELGFRPVTWLPRDEGPGLSPDQRGALGE